MLAMLLGTILLTTQAGPVRWGCLGGAVLTTLPLLLPLLRGPHTWSYDVAIDVHWMLTRAIFAVLLIGASGLPIAWQILHLGAR